MRKLSLLIVHLLVFTCLGYSQTVTIGTQVWMTKNLDVSTFRNGDPIPQAKTDEEWETAGENKQPAWCYYENNLANGEKYGKLYNWYAVNDKRGLAPKGWHIPNYNELKILIKYLGGESFPNSGESVSGLGSKMKSNSGWSTQMNGTNESGFNGTPAGYRTWGGIFFDIGKEVRFWSSTRYHQNFAWSISLSEIDILYIIDAENGGALGEGLSVRCLRD